MGSAKMLVYSKCTLFKIITLTTFPLLYVCVQGQSLSVNYIHFMDRSIAWGQIL